MFRDENIARHERELAELRDKLQAERTRAEKAEAEASQAKLVADEAEAERKLRGGWFKQWLDRRAEARAQRRDRYGYGGGWSIRPLNRGHAVVSLSMLLIGILIAWQTYHYCTDIQEGVITGRDYHPPHTSCSTDSNGHTSCTTYPESWTIDIAFEGQDATWSVSEREYDRASYGAWFCYTDIFHSQDNCHGRPR